MSEQKPSIDHRYDVWHVSKGVCPYMYVCVCVCVFVYVFVCVCVVAVDTHTGIIKKLCQLSNTSKCALIAEWIKSITNYLYWYAASAPYGEGDDMVKHWKSLIDHICDIHKGCYHLKLSDRQVICTSAFNTL